ncbi:peptidase M23 [Arsukibacterium ikkense]|uniref:Peptidase M23 n=1 Tax=Arsukibacterium ikkense TaxID=336831 RepID=A0A0M2UZK3_9GAMM|nr:peptidoglycan DD-metalloendopeptidase family protein [Arsukibacterium ikkense]KKO43982.1 peptidase M23 [Arsukibacterium ikkense]
MLLNLYHQLRRRLPLFHQRMIVLSFSLLVVLLAWPQPRSVNLKLSSLLFAEGLMFSQRQSHLLASDDWLARWQYWVQPAAAEDPYLKMYDIVAGDSLSRIFQRFGFGYSQVQRIMAADESLLALDILRPGNRLTLQLDEQLQLLSMELYIHAGKRVLYQRDDSGEFSYQELIDEGRWQSDILLGEIHGSFYVSAKQAGLTDFDIANINQLFRERLNFRRDIQAGAMLQVVRSDNYVGDESTGLSRIEGVRIINRRQTFSAFLHSDGQFYDEKGESLERAFSRYPLQRQFAVSSAFNPRRLHPVTKRVSPHNGTDFRTPIGTPVLAPADGVVTRIENHPFAGKYIEIQHFGSYKTRYLHLDRFLVKRGQQVNRGQRIALSGNTGRSTGPHLHYELHINNRLVNPMTANIPLARPVPAESRAAFAERVSFLTDLMLQQSLLARQPEADNPTAPQ